MVKLNNVDRLDAEHRPFGHFAVSFGNFHFGQRKLQTNFPAVTQKLNHNLVADRQIDFLADVVKAVNFVAVDGQNPVIGNNAGLSRRRIFKNFADHRRKVDFAQKEKNAGKN